MRPTLRLFALVATAGLATSPLAAQSNPNTFSLPPATPTPTSTPAVEGPVDEFGTAPRPIPTDSPSDQPAQSPNPVPSPAPSPAPSRTNAVPSDSASAPAQSVSNPVVQAIPSQSDAGSTTSTPAARPGEQAAPSVADTGSNPEPEQPDEAGSQEPSLGAAPQGDLTLPSDFSSLGPDQSAASVFDQPITQWPWWVWLTAVASLAALLAGLWWMIAGRRRKPAVGLIEPPRPIAGAPSASDELDLQIDLGIASATRSVRMLTITYDVMLINRSAKAARDISLNIALSTARQGAASITQSAPEPATDTKAIARLGPHQSERVRGQISMPTQSIAVLRQGSKPIFIPLMDVEVRVADTPVITQNHVIGLPGPMESARVQPIALDGPVGTLRGLRARAITA